MNINITGNEWVDSSILVIAGFALVAIVVGIAIAAVKALLAGAFLAGNSFLSALKNFPDRILAATIATISLVMFWKGEWLNGAKTAFAAVGILAVGFGFRWVKNKLDSRGWLPRTAVSSGGAGKSDLASYSDSIRKPTNTFAQVSGMTALKAELMEAVKDHQRTHKGEKQHKNGILLSGDPGNGKTFIAEALAGELGWGFMPITIGDIKSKWIGQTTEQLQAAFNTAKRSGKLILFFDECDSMLINRGIMSMDQAGAVDAVGTTNAFLTNIVDIRKCKDVIVIAATNFIDKLDSAAIRDGRFDFKIHIPNPDYDARLGLLTNFSREKGEKGWKVEFEEGVLARLSKRWEGFSVARIRAVAEKILKNSKAQGRKEVGVKEAMAAMREVQGSLGEALPENTLRLEEMHFDGDDGRKLMSLAKRMENIEEIERLGGQVPKGVLFFGPPGTGKTAVAKALSMTSGWAFLPTSGNRLLGDADEFTKVLNKARDLRPCIVFIDEADDVLMDRSSNPYGKSVTNRILAEMDGTKQLNDVMFIAATNHPDSLDGAAVRGGRFSERFEFKIPEDDTVLEIVKGWISDMKDKAPFHDEFKPETVAKFLEGLAPSDIKDKLQQAVNTGAGRIIAEEGEDRIMLHDLQAVL